MNAQIITSNGKPAFAVLPIAEYQRLLALAYTSASSK
jgi:prevent-host-death family protein